MRGEEDKERMRERARPGQEERFVLGDYVA
jgi:hypothetical protein